jgi:hypothetical protein
MLSAHYTTVIMPAQLPCAANRESWLVVTVWRVAQTGVSDARAVSCLLVIRAKVTLSLSTDVLAGVGVRSRLKSS